MFEMTQCHEPSLNQNILSLKMIHGNIIKTL